MTIMEDDAKRFQSAAQALAVAGRSAINMRIEKAFLTDLETGESKEFLFNPAELEEVFGVNWQMFESPGMSHKRPQFVSCDNLEWNVTAVFDQLVYETGKQRPAQTGGPNTNTIDLRDGSGARGTPNGPSETEDWRNYLLSLATPRRPRAGGLNRFASASPPPIHFEWPGLVSTTVRVRRGKIKHTLFQPGTARPRIMVVDLNVFEDPAERMFSDDVRARGTIRPWATISSASRGGK